MKNLRSRITRQIRKIERLHTDYAAGKDVSAKLAEAYDELNRLECMEKMGISSEQYLPQ